MDEKEYSWQVEGTLPKKENNWLRPVWFQVSATTVEQAIEKVRKRYPEITFIKVIRDRHVEAVIT